MRIRNTLRTLVSCVCGLCLSLPGVNLWGAQQESESDRQAWQKHYSAERFESPSGGHLLYRFMEPETKADQEKYPLVLFLHGAGERGDNNRAQMVHGLRDFASAKNRETYPAYVVAPQCPANRKWVEVPWDGQKHVSPEQPSDSLQMCNELIDDLIKRYPIDTDRIYVTGLSMGGFGTFDAATRWPERFAAAAPICGGGDESEQAIARLKSVPLWIVHGDADKVVVPDRSRRMVKALTEAGAKPNYIELEGVAHDSWTATYRDDKFFEWLFSQNKANRTPK